MSDEQEFDDFESAPPLEEPQTFPEQTKTSSVHSQPPSYPNNTDEKSEKPAFQAQISVVPHQGSSQTPDVESGNTEQSPEPHLVKKGSDHLGDIISLQPSLDKTHSLNESNVPSVEESLHLHAIGDVSHPLAQSIIPENQSQPLTESHKEQSPQNRQSTDINALGAEFNFSQEQDSKDKENTVNGQQNLVQPEEPQEASQPEVRKESEEFVFQQSEPRKESQDFVFQSAQPETRKESDQFGVFAQAEPRKQSEDFVFQSSEGPKQSTEYKPNQQALEESEVNQNAQQKQQQLKESPLLEQPQQEQKYATAEEVEPVESAEEKLPEKAEEEEQDEFGQFQETVQENNVQQQPQEDVQLRVETQKLPYGQDAAQKQTQLIQFVNSLPDYSFLLAQAFLQAS